MSETLNTVAGSLSSATPVADSRESVRILLVDDHALIRESVSQTLANVPGFTVVGTARDGAEAVELAMRLDPEILLMDIDMPGLSCFDAARRLVPLKPQMKIIFLSAFVHDRYIEQSLAANAKGYLTKHDSPEKLIEAIRAVAKGELFFSEQIWGRLVITPKGIRLAEPPPSRVSTLTLREVEVLRYLSSGLSRKETAATMHVSIKTVEMHTVNIMRKLDIHDRVELTRFAIREGIVNP